MQSSPSVGTGPHTDRTCSEFRRIGPGCLSVSNHRCTCSPNFLNKSFPSSTRLYFAITIILRLSLCNKGSHSKHQHWYSAERCVCVCGLGSFLTWGTAAHRQFEWKQTGMTAVLKCESVFKTHTHSSSARSCNTHTHVLWSFLGMSSSLTAKPGLLSRRLLNTTCSRTLGF